METSGLNSVSSFMIFPVFSQHSVLSTQHFAPSFFSLVIFRRREQRIVQCFHLVRLHFQSEREPRLVADVLHGLVHRAGFAGETPFHVHQDRLAFHLVQLFRSRKEHRAIRRADVLRQEAADHAAYLGRQSTTLSGSVSRPRNFARARAKAFSRAVASFSDGVTGVVHKSMLIVLVDLREALSLNVTSHWMSYCSASKPLMLRFWPVGSTVKVVFPILSRHPVSSSAIFLVGGFFGIGLAQPFSGHSAYWLDFPSSVHASFLSSRSMRVSESPAPARRVNVPAPLTLDSVRCMLARQ